MSAWSGKNCNRGHSKAARTRQERDFMERYEAIHNNNKGAIQMTTKTKEGPYERRYESEHIPPCENCHIERTFPDANTQWEMGGRAAIHHIKFCPLHSAAPDLLASVKDLIAMCEVKSEGRGLVPTEVEFYKKALAAIAKAGGK